MNSEQWRLLHAYAIGLPFYGFMSWVFYRFGLGGFCWVPAAGLTCLLASKMGRWHHRLDRELDPRRDQ